MKLAEVFLDKNYQWSATQFTMNGGRYRSTKLRDINVALYWSHTEDSTEVDYCGVLIGGAGYVSSVSVDTIHQLLERFRLRGGNLKELATRYIPNYK